LRDAAALSWLVAAGVVPCLAYLSVGSWLLRAIGSAARGSERLALAFVLGSGVASLALLGLRLCDVPVPLAAVALVAVAGIPALGARGGASGPRAARSRAVACVDAATLGIATWTFAAALAPETWWDGFEYHLPIVTAWAEGPIRLLPGWIDAELRTGVDLLYVPAVAAGEPDAAAAVTAAFAAALAALVRAEATRRATPGAGAWAALFTLLVPFTVANAASTYVDLGVGAYGFIALLSADRWNRSGERRSLLLAAACAAFAANAKLHAALIAPAVMWIVAAGGRRPRAREAARAIGLAAALAAPWFVKQALTSGNPFFPLFAQTFGLGPYDAVHVSLRRHRLTTDYPAARDLAGFIQYLVSLTFGRNVHSGGLVGPLPLALGVLAWRRPTRATAALLAVFPPLVLLQFVYAPALRFGAPLLPFLAIAGAVGGARLARSGPLARATLAAALAVLCALHLVRAALEFGPRIAALRDPRGYERAVFPDQDALRRMVARGEGVVAIPKGAAAWMDRPVYLLHWERNGEIFFEPVLGHWTPPEAALALLERRGVRSLVVDVEPPLPKAGLRHATIDAWIAAGTARIRRDVAPLPARRGRVWVLLDLAPSPPGGAPGEASPKAAPSRRRGGSARPPSPQREPGRADPQQPGSSARGVSIQTRLALRAPSPLPHAGANPGIDSPMTAASGWRSRHFDRGPWRTATPAALRRRPHRPSSWRAPAPRSQAGPSRASRRRRAAAGRTRCRAAGPGRTRRSPRGPRGPAPCRCPTRRPPPSPPCPGTPRVGGSVSRRASPGDRGRPSGSWPRARRGARPRPAPRTPCKPRSSSGSTRGRVAASPG
jgi:hypothetical protein